MLANLLGGWLRNLEGPLNRKALGSVVVLGTDGNWKVKMLWIVDQKELPAEFSNPDAQGLSFEYNIA